MEMGYQTYKSRLVARLRAYSLFLDHFQQQLTPETVETLRACIACNRAHEEEKPLSVLASGAPLIHRLRILGTATPFFFALRRRFFQLLSGW
jgi:hypothetical protein